jgi:putative mRNA 3-end processing factor
MAPIKPADLLRPRPEGLYCPPGDFYIDPVRPVARAVITHGHSDHARPGHGAVLATPQTLDIMAVRCGEGYAGAVQPLAYGESAGRDGVEVSLAPAGHILGSAQAVVRFKGLTMVVSGDYKRSPDPTCAPFEPVPCDVFVTEATFGLPVFRFPPPEQAASALLHSLAQFPERAHLVGVYALGKAQRLTALLRQAGYDQPIHVHGALERLNALYERWGVKLGALEPATGSKADALKQRSGGANTDFGGQIVLAPPSALDDRWSRRFPDPVNAFASGWMRVRARARQRHVELPLILSDHADWDELTATIAELRPQELWITHGREEALARWAELNGVAARPLAIVGYEDEEET